MYLSGRGSHHKGILEMLLGGGGEGGYCVSDIRGGKYYDICWYLRNTLVEGFTLSCMSGMDIYLYTSICFDSKVTVS